MSLLDDVSIVVTPNGYKAGELYAVIPVPSEGAEMLSQPVDLVTDFLVNSGGVIVDADTFTTAGGTFDGIRINSFFTIGTRYKLIIDGDTTSSGFTIGETTLSGNEYGSGFGTHYFTAIGTGSLWIRQQTSGTTNITSFSIKEYTSADMDVTRATAATRVDENGLVNYAEILGSDLITNGDFNISGALVGNSYTLGWRSGDSGLTISNGVLNLYSDGSGFVGRAYATNGIDSYSNVLITGKTYKISYEVTENNDNSTLYAYMGAFIAIDKTVGIHTTYITATTHFFLFRNAGSDTTIKLDNVSVKEVTRDNVPRIDYTGGGCPHILAEPQRANDIQYSEDFTQSYWRKDKVTVTANSIISPSGQLDASLVQETVYTGGIPSFDLLSSITLGAGSHTFTFYVKNNNGRFLGISFGSNAQRVRTNFDFNTNTFKTLIFNGTTTGSASFTTLGDYYRISITATFPSSTAADTVLMPLATDTYPFYAFQDSENRSFYLWGTQLEAGSYATSYIPTSGSTVTRNQDIFTRDGIGSLINSTEGVLFLEMAALADDLTDRRITLSDGSVSNQVIIGLSRFASNINAEIHSGGVLQTSGWGGTGVTQTNNNKFALSWGGGTMKFYINGSPTSPQTGITSPIGLNSLKFSIGNDTLNMFGKVKQLQIFKTALTDEQLLQLTGESGTDFYESYAEMASALTYTIQ